MREISGTDYIVFRRTLHHRNMVDREKFSLPSSSTRPNYPDGCRRRSQSGYRTRASYLPPHRSIVASTVFISSPAGNRKGCPASRTQTSHSTAKGQCYYRGNASHNTAECNALEYAQHGQSSQCQQGDCMPDMATAQSQTSSCRNIQNSVETSILSRNCKISSDCISILRTKRWCCASTKRAKFKPSTVRNFYCRLRPGIPARQTHDYTRHGTTTLFAALSMLDGKVIGDCMPRHRHQEFIRFLQLINVNTPLDLDLHLIVDNYGTHKHPRVLKWLQRHPRFHLHFTPTSSSWLNMVERWFREITDKRIRRGSFKSVPDLIKAILQYLDNHNQNPRVFIWSASVERIMTKITKCKEALETLH